MQHADFQRLVARLEQESAQSPAAYRLKVAGLALLGFGVIAVFLGALGAGFLVIAGVLVAVAFSGAGAAVLALKFGKFLLLLAIPFWYLLKGAAQALFVRLPAPDGREVRPAEAPALFDALEGMRRAMKGPRFHHVLVVDGVNAAVVQRPAFGLLGWPRNYLLLGLPLLECFSPKEALAVVAHEYGHLAGSHGRFSAFIYRLRLTWGTLQEHAESVQGWLGKLAKPLVAWYVPYFNAYTFVLARANEYQADAASAELVGAANAAHALKRVNVAGAQHEQFIERTYAAIREQPQPPQDLMQRWAQWSAQPADPGDARRWLQSALDRETNPWDTHPTLRARLAALPLADEAADAPPPALHGDSAARQWFGAGLERLRQELQQRWAQQVQQPWSQRHAELREKAQRLQTLKLRETRPAEEEIELVELTMQLEPDTDVRPQLAAFNEAHPDHATGLFLHGIACLQRDDAAGLALLDRAMQLDVRYTKAACEHAYAFLRAKQDTEAAERYAARWQARDDAEQRFRREWLDVRVDDTLLPPQLDPQALAQVRALLASAALKHVKETYIVRRVLASDPQAVQYLLAITMTWWGTRGGRAQKAVDALAALEWPVPLVIVTLHDRFAGLRKKLRAIAGARLDPAQPGGPGGRARRTPTART